MYKREIFQVKTKTYNTEPSKDNIDDVVHRLHHEKGFPDEAVSRIHDLPDMGDGVNCSKERAIEPSSSLRNEFWKRIRDVGFANGALDIFQDPATMSEGRRSKETAARTSWNWLLQ